MNSPLDQLTKREREVLILLARGSTVKDIAATLGIAPKTVDVHRHKIMNTLGVHKTVLLAHFAIAVGLIDPIVPNSMWAHVGSQGAD